MQIFAYEREALNFISVSITNFSCGSKKLYKSVTVHYLSRYPENLLEVSLCSHNLL